MSGGSLAELEEALGHRFDDPRLLETALVHASVGQERDVGRGNERLEFLGDAVVGLVVAELLYLAHPDWTEGQLSRARAGLVNRRAFAACGRRLALGSWLELGRSERQSGGEDKDSILSDAFEAVLGAIFLDAGLEPVERLVRRLFGEAIERGAVKDAKTAFQEWAHAELKVTPRYETTGDSEEEDDDVRFTVEVRVGEEVWGRGVGRSKRQAEQHAAGEALARLEAGYGDGDG